jgi:thiamine kinase-like enzyme
MTTNEKLGKRIGGGWTAQIYEWNDGRVLKLFEPWVPLPFAEHEVDATQSAQKLGLPVPAIDRAIEYNNCHGIVMEYVVGRTMMDCMFSNFWKTNSYAHILAELQFSVNSKKAPQSFHSMNYVLETNILNEKTIPQETKEAVLRILEKLPVGDALCHYDLHPMNVMMSPKGSVIIDWSGASRGDPMADAARTWFLCTLPPLPWPSSILVNTWLKSFYAAYWKKYTSLISVDEQKLNLWKTVVLAARILEEKADSMKQFLLKQVEKRLKSH